MNHTKEIPSMDAWLKEAKAHSSAENVGMYLTHNGVVRATAKAKVRQGDANVLAQEAAACMAALPDAENPHQALGDALLMACAYARAVNVDPEIALNEAADAFVNRFEALEKQLKVMDSAAFSLCREHDLPIVVFDFYAADLDKVLAGDTSEGTIVRNCKA